MICLARYEFLHFEEIQTYGKSLNERQRAYNIFAVG